MKELSIEEKAKRYDERLEKARKWYDANTNEGYKGIFEDIFPELKESEDERIRKDMIETIKKEAHDFPSSVIADKSNSWIAWLEKQGEQKPVEWGVHNTKKGDILSNGTIVLVVDSLGKFEGRTIINSWYYANSEKFYGNDISECDRWEIDGFRPASEAEKNFLFKMMNKEGYMWDSEKNELVDIEKPVEWSEEDEKIRKAIIEHFKHKCAPVTFSGVIVEKAIAWLEKQREYKPKVKTQFVYPKFRVGDVISPNEEDGKCDYTIVGFNEHLGDYLVDGGNIPSCSIGIEFIDANFHIKEQKPVELEKEEKSRLMKKCVHRAYQQGYDTGFFMATTELEHKQEWSEEDETTKNNISHIIRQYDKISKKENQPCWYVGDCLLWMQNIKDRVQPQPKQEWSEEDDKIRSSIIDFIRYELNHSAYIGTAGVDSARQIEWLKSLCPQKQQQEDEWSEEDVYALNTLSAMVANNCFLAKEEIFKLLDWLKSIKSRLYLQEWSEADKRKINRIYSILRQAADTHAFSTSCRLIGDKECIELQDFLKSLRPQNRWKPSDEQIEALESATENCAYSEYQDCLRELIEQLKKLREE